MGFCGKPLIARALMVPQVYHILLLPQMIFQVDENFNIARVEDNDAAMLKDLKAALAALPVAQRPKLMLSIGGWSMSRSDGPVFGKTTSSLQSYAHQTSYGRL